MNKKIVSTAKGTGTDLVVGIAGAGIMGALAGRWAAVLGVGVLAYGHYADNNIAKTAGIGMIAGNAYQASATKDSATPANGFNGQDDELEGFSLKAGMDNVSSYFKRLKNQVPFLPASSAAVSGLGNTQSYFQNPFAGLGEAEQTLLAGNGGTIGRIGSLGNAPSAMGRLGHIA
ncbi:MAG: hypothetical protein V4543_00735 [Bacteroidota bacterium]